MSEVNKKHQKEFEDKVEEAKKSIKVSWINLKHQLYCSFSDIEWWTVKKGKKNLHLFCFF